MDDPSDGLWKRWLVSPLERWGGGEDVLIKRSRVRRWVLDLSVIIIIIIIDDDNIIIIILFVCLFVCSFIRSFIHLFGCCVRVFDFAVPSIFM